MITLHSVSKEMGRGSLRKLVLDQVTWAIPPRGRYVILGHRGSGKTTLINIMGGSRFPTNGWVERRGAVCPGRELVRAIAAARSTPRQIAANLARLYHVAADELVEFLRRFADLDGVMDFPATTLPNQIRQRFTYALIYAVPFEFYLFDENIGPRKGDFSRACRQAFDMRCKDAGVVVTTSAPQIAQQFDAAGGVLFAGKIMLFPTVREAILAFNELPQPDSVETFTERRERSDDEDEGLL